MLQQEVARYGQLIERTDIDRDDIGCITTKVYKYQGKYYVELWENGRNIYFSRMITYNNAIEVFEYQLYGAYSCCKCGEPLFKCISIRETEDEDGYAWRSFCKDDYEELKASGMTDEEIYDSFETNAY